MSNAVVMIVVEDDVLRAHVASAVVATGHTPVVVESVEGGLEQMAGRDGELAALVMGGSSQELGPVNVPVVVVVRDRVEEIASARRGLHVVRYADGLQALVRALEQAAAARESSVRIASGSGRIDKARTPMDLHAYTIAKLRQFLGEARATQAMAKITAGLPGGLIVTTKDLHLAAIRLRAIGDLEATIASLLSGQAVLLDSDRTLRS